MQYALTHSRLLAPVVAVGHSDNHPHGTKLQNASLSLNTRPLRSNARALSLFYLFLSPSIYLSCLSHQAVLAAAGDEAVVQTPETRVNHEAILVVTFVPVSGDGGSRRVEGGFKRRFFRAHMPGKVAREEDRAKR